jgi:HEAT repeat protein
MLRSGDAASRRSSVAALGDLGAAGEAATRILGEVLAQPGESVRAAAASALGRIALRNPAGATPLLERALGDAAHDVRAAAVAGLAGVWARSRPAAELATALASAETDGSRRLVALQALVLQAQSPDKGADAARALDHVAETGPPLARLAAQIGRAFLHSKPAEMEAFLERLFGG